MHKILLVFTLALLVASCSSTTKKHNHSVVLHPKTSKVIISREANKALVEVPAVFGYDGEDKETLSSGETKEILVPVGKHEFFVKSNKMGKDYKIALVIKKDEVMCLRSVVNKKYFKMKSSAINPAILFTSPFNLKQYNCNKI